MRGRAKFRASRAQNNSAGGQNNEDDRRRHDRKGQEGKKKDLGRPNFGINRGKSGMRPTSGIYLPAASCPPGPAARFQIAVNSLVRSAYLSPLPSRFSSKIASKRLSR